MKPITRIDVCTVKFCVPQGGKGAHERKAAANKGHVHMHMNDGHKVKNAEKCETAILWNGSVTWVCVAVVDVAITAIKLRQVV